MDRTSLIGRKTALSREFSPMKSGARRLLLSTDPSLGICGARGRHMRGGGGRI